MQSKAAASSPPAQNGSSPTTIPISEETQNELRALEQGIVKRCYTIGQIDYQLVQLALQVSRLEHEKTELIQSLHAETERKNVRVREVARGVGIDPEDPQSPLKGNWNLDLAANPMVFQRVG